MSLTISNPLFISSLIHTTKTLNFSPQNPFSTSNVSSRAIPIPLLSSKNAAFPFNKKRFNQNPPFACFSSTVPTSTKNYEFSDDPSDMELRIQLGGIEIQNPRDVYVDVEDSSLTIRVKSSPTIRVKSSPSMVTLMETKSLFDRIKPSGTIWYVDDDQLVINLKKQDPDMKWPNIVESWESLAAGSMQFLKGTSIYNVDDLTEINQKVARELAVGLGHVRAVVSTLEGQQGAARRANKWQHLYAGFTVWLSVTEAKDEDSAKEEAKRNFEEATLGYTNADVVVKLQGWDADHAKSVAQASLSALEGLILSDKKLPGKKSLHIRLGCRGDWPNIKPPPGWDPSIGEDVVISNIEQTES